MKANKKANLVLLSIASVTSLALIGSTMGTLSWYAYSTHTLLSYTGTSVRKSVLLNVGIVDNDENISDDTINEYHLVKETKDGNTIVWATSADGLGGDIIEDYLDDSPYAYNMLSPVTSNERAINATSDLVLYESPEFGKTAISDIADTEDYVKIPFAFKIMNNDSELVANQKIWLTDVDVQTSGAHLNDAVRVFVSNSQEKFLLKPNDNALETSATKVGGLLDLNGDNIYDYNIEDSNKEYIYGHYTGTPSFIANPRGEDYYDNVNHTPYENDSTFYAKRGKDASLLNTSSVTFLEAHYQTFGTVKPKVSGDGTFYSEDGIGKPIAYTDSSDAVGYADLTIYIEGWDHAIVNEAAGYSFNLGLQFEINKI